ncbi:MAG: nucleotide exchange factor GrpE [Nanobdellota archaeon]
MINLGKSENKENKEQNEDKGASAEELESHLKRLQAEFENYMKRTETEKEQYKYKYISDFASKIIPIIDQFEIALKHECSDKNFYQGMMMIYSQLIDALKSEGIKEINPEGKEYDMNKHEAISVKEDKEIEENEVVQVVKKGYELNGRVIRRASVIVNKIEDNVNDEKENQNNEINENNKEE